MIWHSISKLKTASGISHLISFRKRGAWGSIFRHCFLDKFEILNYLIFLQVPLEQPKTRCGSTEINLQPLRPAFFPICSPRYSPSCCVTPVPYFDWKELLLFRNGFLFVSTLEKYRKLLHFRPTLCSNFFLRITCYFFNIELKKCFYTSGCNMCQSV